MIYMEEFMSWNRAQSLKCHKTPNKFIFNTPIYIYDIIFNGFAYPIGKHIYMNGETLSINNDKIHKIV